MTRTRPFPYLLLISGTRKTSNSTGEFTGFHLARVRLMSNVRAIGQVPFGKHVLLAPLSTAAAFEIGLLGSFGSLPESSASLPRLSSTTRTRLSTPPIRRVTPGRHQKRHVEMAFGLAHRKPQRNSIEKRWIRCRHVPCGKVVPDAERQFVTADRHRPAANQRLIGSAIRVGDRARHDTAGAELGQLDQFDRYPRRRPAAVGIEHVGR